MLGIDWVSKQSGIQMSSAHVSITRSEYTGCVVCTCICVTMRLFISAAKHLRVTKLLHFEYHGSIKEATWGTAVG